MQKPLGMFTSCFVQYAVITHTSGQFVRYTLVVLVVPVPHCNHSHDYGIGLAECQVNSDV